MKQVIVTTSWDDGHVLDLRLATLLKKYGIKGTFYISPQDRELKPRERLNDQEIQQLGQDFEIGSHTMTHPVMTTLTPREITTELIKSRQYLQRITGQNVTSFCYPRGIYDKSMLPLVRDAGYNYARTVQAYELGKPDDWLQAGTSIEVHRFAIPRILHELFDVVRYSHWNPIQTIHHLRWERRAIDMFDGVVRNGGVYHLWGHSWVIEREGKWEAFERVLAHIQAQPSVTYCTNAELRERLE